MSKNKVILIAGTTASGKTSLAINIANFLKDQHKLYSEIINADSMQLYNELKIITAYPSEDELNSAKHTLFGVLSPNESSSVASWLKIASLEIDRINSQDGIAIVCGGTGFYINALLNGISNIPEIPQEIRNIALDKFQLIGRDAFFDELSILDPSCIKFLHKNDTQRILRAYEVITYTEKPLSEWWNDKKIIRKLDILGFFSLLPKKELIHKKCHDRIVQMINSGAIEEVSEFNKKYEFYSGSLKNAIGYKEISQLLSNNIELDNCINQMYINTKQYVKRQSTWLRNQFKSANTINTFGNDHETLNRACCHILNNDIMVQ